jgi:hypothetical protein
MRYEEMPGPLEGWTYDEHGTIYTATGYRCTAQHIECALWLMQCYSLEVRRYLIHSDEEAGALRPVYELSDLSANVPPTRIRTKPEKRVLRDEKKNLQPRRGAVSALRAQAKDQPPSP